MSALMNALDSTTNTQLGENGHKEYAWSNDYQEKILQLSFQMTRSNNPAQIAKLATLLENVLKNMKGAYEVNQITREKYFVLMKIAYKMNGHTRDIENGKGEYMLAYMQIVVWVKFFPELAQYMLYCFVHSDIKEHPYGSWKDIKYFCNYAKQQGLTSKDPIMIYAFELMVTQLRADSVATDNIQLAGKWAPREGSTKFGWIFTELSQMYFPHYMTHAVSVDQKSRATSKCKMDFRKVLTALNMKLDTVQVKQCANTWSQINHAKTTSVTIFKQKKAFLNVKKDGSIRSELPDRIQCADSFKERIKKAVAGEIEIKGKRIGLNNFTSQAIDLLRQTTRTETWQAEIDLLNAQWKNNSSQTGSLGPMIAMVDFSGSMEGDPINCAMALGCRVAEKSILGKRVLSFSTNPTWHNLEGCNTFVEMIQMLQTGEVGYSTNLLKAFDTILNAIIEKKLKPAEVSNMIFAIFSDMQIDMAEGPGRVDTGALYETVNKMYSDAGIRLWNEPFNPPHLLFWNLRSTSGFPALSTQKNVSMLSGFSPALLNSFCEKGLEAFENLTPWALLVEQVNHPRYKCLEDKMTEFMCF